MWIRRHRFVQCRAAALIVAIGLSAVAQAQPQIVKRGTLECDMVETTPLVFHGTLYRFEYVRDDYAYNAMGRTYFRFIDVASGKIVSSAVGLDHHLGSAFVDGDSVYVFGVPTWGADRIRAWRSNDLLRWTPLPSFVLDGWSIFNTSVCKGPDGYVMALEINKPEEETGTAFTTRFAKSWDLVHWAITEPACVYTKERYSACPSIRYYDGYYYMVYLASYPGEWEPEIVRSRDLKQWELSPFRPIMHHDNRDRTIANPRLNAAERQRIATAKNANNSDVDFVEFNGKTVIYYSWGNQHGVEHLAEAEYAGSEKDFLTGFFPEK